MWPIFTRIGAIPKKERLQMLWWLNTAFALVKALAHAK